MAVITAGMSTENQTGTSQTEIRMLTNMQRLSIQRKAFTALPHTRFYSHTECA
jgi:hypothetical protein